MLGSITNHTYPVPNNSCSLPPVGFTFLRDIDSSILQEIRYYSNHNFMGRRVEGYNVPECVLTNEAASALSAVQRDALNLGYSLKVYDCYRPQRSVDEFVWWSQNDYDLLMKQENYPDLSKLDLFPDYIATKSGHTRGSTTDLTIVPLLQPYVAGTSLFVEEQPVYFPGQPLVSCYAPLFSASGDKTSLRFADNSLDMGTGFDCLSPWANTNTEENITDVQRENRALLVGLMAQHGFKNYAGEWWHYTLNSEPFNDRYFDFPIQRNDDGCVSAH